MNSLVVVLFVVGISSAYSSVIGLGGLGLGHGLGGLTLGGGYISPAAVGIPTLGLAYPRVAVAPVVSSIATVPGIGIAAPAAVLAPAASSTAIAGPAGAIASTHNGLTGATASVTSPVVGLGLGHGLGLGLGHGVRLI